MTQDDSVPSISKSIDSLESNLSISDPPSSTEDTTILSGIPNPSKRAQWAEALKTQKDSTQTTQVSSEKTLFDPFDEIDPVSDENETSKSQEDSKMENILDDLSYEEEDKNQAFGLMVIVFALSIISSVLYYIFTLSIILFITLSLIIGLLFLVIYQIFRIAFKSTFLMPLISFIFIVFGVTTIFGINFWLYYNIPSVNISEDTIKGEVLRSSSEIVLTFSKPILNRDIEKTLELIPEISVTDIQSSSTGLISPISFMPFGNEFTITFDGTLDSDTEYVLSLSELKDIFGRGLSREEIRFTSPTILPVEYENIQNTDQVSFLLEDNASEIALDKEIDVVFNNPINPTDFKYEIVPNIPLTLDWNDRNTSLTFTHAELFDQSTEYTLTILFIDPSDSLETASTTIDETASSTPLDDSFKSEYQLTFKTARALDVVGSIPEPRSQNVPLSSSIVLSLNYSIYPDQDLGSLITLSPKAEYELQYSKNAITLVLTKPLKEDTVYTLILDKSIVSNKITSFQDDFSLVFSTIKSKEIPPSDPLVDTEELGDGEPTPKITEDPVSNTLSDPIEDNTNQNPDEQQLENPSPPQGSLEMPNVPDGYSIESDLEDKLLLAYNTNRTEKIYRYNDTDILSRMYDIDIATIGFFGNNHIDSRGRTTKDRLSLADIVDSEYIEGIYAYDSFDATQILDSFESQANNLYNNRFKKAGISVIKSSNNVYYVVMLLTENK